MAEKTDIVGNLPVEIVQNIFMNLTSEDLCNALKCCKRWRYMASSEYFWKTKLKKDFYYVEEEHSGTESYQNYVKKFFSRWKGMYMYNCELNYNWRYGVCKRDRLAIPAKIENLVYVDHQILIVAVESNEILVIDVSNGMIKKSFPAEKCFHVEKDDDRLFAMCANDANFGVLFKVWDLQSYEELLNFQTDLSPDCCDKSFNKHLILYLAANCQLRIFNMKTEKFEYCRDDLNSVCSHNDVIATGSWFGIIEVMDLNYNQLMTLNCCQNTVVIGIQMQNDYLVTVSMKPDDGVDKGGVLCVWNLKTKAKLYSMPGFVTSLKENILACVQPAYFLLFDMSTKKYLLKIKREYHSYVFMSNNLFVFSGHQRKKEKTAFLDVWCPRTQQLLNRLCLQRLYPEIHLFRACEPNFSPIVSKTNIAHIDKTDLYSVHVMDFKPI